MKRVGAVICNFNKKEDVLNCIQSVLESKYTDYDLYVVDNASSDGSAEAIREKYGSQVTVLVNAENLGGSGGFNTGLRKALEKGYEYLYCLDNDVLVDENAMGELVAFLDTHPGSGMAGSRVYHMENPGVIQQFGQIVDFTVPKPNSLEKPMQTESPMSNIPMRLPPALLWCGKV